MTRFTSLTIAIILAALVSHAETESPIFNYERPTNQDLLNTKCDLETYPDADTVIMFLHEGSQHFGSFLIR